MSSGPCVLLALEAPDAIKKWRDTMGATDPAKADAGTLRKDFGESIGRNATHGSDAPETAAFELGYFFRGMELTVVRGFGLRSTVDRARLGARWDVLLIVVGLLIVAAGVLDRRSACRSAGCPATSRSGAGTSASTFR